ncbi:MAG: tRNA (N6-threonylcarbamoyladenosine(37)-N6)-methyltransferase TrmO [Candidatus Methanospirareceae archaeon]
MLRFIGVVEKANEKGVSKVRIFDEFCEGLGGLDTFSHIIILYWFHLRATEERRRVLKVIPKGRPGNPEVGVFTSRSPSRPNPIGLCVAELVKQEGNILSVKGLDAFEGAPIIDIKPYIPQIDAFPKAAVPQWARHDPKT